MGKIDENKKKKKETLFNSAYDLFITKGINSTAISDIVEKAGVAKGTFYLYFKDKYEIRDCLIARQTHFIFQKAHRELSAIFEKMVPDQVEDGIVYLLENIIDQFTENPEILRFISKNLSWGIFSNLRIQDLDNQNCMDIFDGILERSSRKYRQRELMIFMIVELVNSTCYNVILNHAPVAVQELKKELICTVRGIMDQFAVAIDDTGVNV